jgi:RimJ/RimL family protein N-acetyltransferase
LIIYRDLKPSDFESMADNFYSFLDELEENPDLGLVLPRKRPSISEELQWFSDLYKKVEEGKTVATVAEGESKVIGMCEIEGLRSESDISHRGELGLVVSKEYRGKGIGTELIRLTLEKCKGKFEVVQLGVFSINRAKRLYERFGFQTYGHNPHAIKRGGRYYAEDLMLLKL